MVLKCLLFMSFISYSFAISLAPTTFDMRSLSILISQKCDKNILISKDVKNLNVDYFFNKDVSCFTLFKSYKKLISSKGLYLTNFDNFYVLSKKPFIAEKPKQKPNYSNVELSLKIIELNNNELSKKGFRDLLQSNLDTQITLNDFSKLTFNSLFTARFSGLLNVLIDKGFINIVSQPKVLVANHKTTVMNVGDTVSVLTSSVSNDKNDNGSVRNTYIQKDIGLTIKVTPDILENGIVSLNVDFVDETLKSYDKGLITTSKRSINSFFNVKNKKAIIIGGLTSNQDITSNTKVPLLGDIPILSYLFSYTSKNNIKRTMSIYIKVRLVK